MSTINKVTTCKTPDTITDDYIQTHIDEQNAEGWYLVGVDNAVGWFRFFWAKEVVEE